MSGTVKTSNYVWKSIRVVARKLPLCLKYSTKKGQASEIREATAIPLRF